MSFQEKDIVNSICHLCDKTTVVDAINHLNGPDDPDWDFIADYVNELPEWSEFCEFWEDPSQYYTRDDVKALCSRYANWTLAQLDTIYDGVDL